MDVTEEDIISGLILVVGFILITMLGVLFLWIYQKYCCYSRLSKGQEEGYSAESADSPPPEYEEPPPYPGVV